MFDTFRHFNEYKIKNDNSFSIWTNSVGKTCKLIIIYKYYIKVVYYKKTIIGLLNII